jgi:hypothetical protein
MKVFTKHSTQIPSGQDISSPDAPVNLANKIQAVMPGYARLPADVIREDVFLLPEKLPLAPTRRLVVLVPPGEIAENVLTRRVWQLAKDSGLSVLYLTLSREEDQILYHRRRLTNLIMMTSYGNVRVHSNVSAAKDWLDAVKQILQPGDVLVCLANHQVFHHLVWQRRLGEQLAQALGVPVYMLAGLKIGPPPVLLRMVKEIRAWTISLVLLFAFFSLQVSIIRFTTAPLSTILTCLSVLVELYLLLKVNEWIG